MEISELVNFTKTLKVLYVEDNLEARESTVSMLEIFFDDIVTAIDGVDGLDKFNKTEKDFDLIISDMNMPKMNGLDMIRKIKEKSSGVHIVVLSAHKESGYLRDSENVGVDEIILKPIEIDRFLNVLTNLYQKI